MKLLLFAEDFVAADHSFQTVTSAIFPNSPICSAYKVLMNTTKKTVHTQHSFKDLVALTLIRARGLLLLSIQALNFVLSAP